MVDVAFARENTVEGPTELAVGGKVCNGCKYHIETKIGLNYTANCTKRGPGWDREIEVNAGVMTTTPVWCPYLEKK